MKTNATKLGGGEQQQTISNNKKTQAYTQTSTNNKRNKKRIKRKQTDTNTSKQTKSHKQANHALHVDLFFFLGGVAHLRLLNQANQKPTPPKGII